MSDSRPAPLKQIASTVGAAWAAVSGIVSALVMFGVLSSVQGDAIRAAGEAAPATISAVGAAITGVVTIVGGLLAAFRTASHGADHVTPVSSPRDNAGNVLVALGRATGPVA
ncbi:MAG TPA: hypothetical protein VIQ30_09890 [Pseudonocardia sp.]